MIAVRIPAEIRKYKERIIAGLNLRQIICTAIALIITFSIFFTLKNYLINDLLFILIFLGGGIPITIGFVQYHEMPMEKVMLAFIKCIFIYPRKRKYYIEITLKKYLEQTIKEEKKNMNKRKCEKASLERAVLIEEAEERGDFAFDASKSDLLTVSKSRTHREYGGNGKKPRKDKKIKDSNGKSELQIQAEAIEEKIKNDSHYLPTKQENKIRKKWKSYLDKQRTNELKQKVSDLNKLNKLMTKRRSAKTSLPTTAQQTIPYIAAYEEGLFEVLPNKYSKVYKLDNINYKTAKQDVQELIFCNWAEFLNYFSEDLHFSICIDNRIVSIKDLEKQIHYPMTGDKNDIHRREINRILSRQITAGRNDIQSTLLFTLTIDADTPIEALRRFHRLDAEIEDNFRKVGVISNVMSTEERLAYYHDSFRPESVGELNLDFDWIKKQGLSTKDYIAPSLFDFSNSYFTIGDSTYCRAMFLSNLPASLADTFIYDLCENDFPITVTLNVQPVSQTDAMNLINKKLDSIVSDKKRAEKRLIRNNNNPDNVRREILDAYEQTNELYDDVLNKNQRMFFVTITCLVQGKSLEELEANCKVVRGKASKITAQMITLTAQQEEGMKITLPFGYPPQDISVSRTLTTESTAIFIPFSNQELFQQGGYYIGLNQLSRNLVFVDRWKMKTPSGLVMGTTGSGKSFAVKFEINNIMLHDDITEQYIVDPENEYGDFCEILYKASVLKFGPTSDDNLNPFDMVEDYGLDENDPDDLPLSVKKNKALKKKSEYLLSVIEPLLNPNGDSSKTSITPAKKSALDRCITASYKEFLAHDFDMDYVPTFVTLQNELKKDGSKEAEELAKALEYYTLGNMNVFAHRTNVDVENRLVVFNTRDLGAQLKQVASIIILDFIWNRALKNRKKKRRTYVTVDELHIMVQSHYAANYLCQYYKRGRKFGICVTGITQNVDELLRSPQARSMIAGSDYVMLFNQKSEDLKHLVEMFNLSEEQANYLYGADVGSGLVIAERNIVPFVNKFPNDSYLYKLMSTKFGEDFSAEQIKAELDEIMKKAQKSFC